MKQHFILSVALMASAAAKQDVCRALVMSGGGSNGAWEAGVLWGFLNYGNPADFAYDVISGVSAGSMNTSLLAAFEVGQEAEGAQALSDMYKNLHTSDVWVDWPMGKAQGLLLKSGAVDNSPLLTFMNTVLQQYDGIKRRFTIASTNVNTGVYTEWTQDDISFSELPDAAVSSSSIPGFFAPHNWEGKGIFMDGMTAYNINVEGAIKQCKQLVDDESKIIIDTMMCNAPDDMEQTTEVGKTWNNFFRGRDIGSYYHGSDAIASSRKAHPDMQWRYVMKQKNGNSGFDEVNLDGDFTWTQQLAGREDAQNALNGSKDVNVSEFFRQWTEEPSVRSGFQNVGDFVAHRSKQESAVAAQFLQ